MLYCIRYVIKNWQGLNTNTLFQTQGNTKLIPFYFEVKMPSPLKRGVDYGFKKGEQWIFTTID